MWTRTDLKRNAKSVLKKNYWKSVIVSLIFLFITGSGAASTGREASDELSNAKDTFAGMDGSTFLLIIGVVAGAILISMLIGLLLTIFLWNPLHVGCQKFFVNAVEDQEAGLGDVLYSFKNGYGHIGGIMFVRTVFICLWSVLLIIPGIVKMYEYMMVPFILAENPDMSREEVFERLNEVFRDVFDEEDITVDEGTTAEDIDGWDSLEHINLMAAVESEFGIKFSMGQVVTMKNVGEMADIILQKV